MAILYSFPLHIGADRICLIAWEQVHGVANTGHEVLLLAGSVARPPGPRIKVIQTLSRGKWRIPVRLLGGSRLICRLHDWASARWLERHPEGVDLVHGWPLGSLETFRAAKRLGIPTVIERPNAHTAFAFQVADQEHRLTGVPLPSRHDHAPNAGALAREILEYEAADALLCPSEFVKKTFLDQGFPETKLLRHQYGYDPGKFTVGNQGTRVEVGVTMLYAGVGEPRKGLHYALKAWFASGAYRNGRFLICGSFMAGYKEKLGSLLDHPSVVVMGHRKDLHVIMRNADLFVLPSVEEGSALVTYEARASGCVLVVSDASGAVCEHLTTGMIHESRNQEELTAHLKLLSEDRGLRARLRAASIESVAELSWNSAARVLARAYENVLTAHRQILPARK